MKNTTFFLNMVLLLILFGCVTTTLATQRISESEAFKYEKEYLAEYESLKKNFSNSSNIKWIQPSNKKESCKIYVGFDPSNDITAEVNYKLFWDGDCKDGYAYGLGREFQRGTVLNSDHLAIYQGKKEEPHYYIEKFNLDNITREGDISNGYYVVTAITDEIFNFDIIIVSGFMGSSTQPIGLTTQSSPFEDHIILQKSYPNFAYKIFDMSNSEFEQTDFGFEMVDSDGIRNGFMIETLKDGQSYSHEVVNGEVIRWRVQLPDSYFTKIVQVNSEIAQASQKAKDAQKEALRVKKQYMYKICKDSVQVTFIDNSEYKSICNESVNNNLREKIENKLARINSQKQQKREQLNQQKLIDAQAKAARLQSAREEDAKRFSERNARRQAVLDLVEERQANAATRSAAAAERANDLQSWDNLDLDQYLQPTNSYSLPLPAPYSRTNRSNNRKIQNCWTVSGIEFCN